ncbi:helix-turn-helix domain-containing protein [Nocardioides bizhenqiangii]|uniref:Helix-turn-helix transcriptional regulator n=1 Tax=Nocardioides bizhenqiangii TaxID=3095076 RepID=A0ABZ0ZTN7_9ACTN|nr:helix-turn-helix transcriptional regulator [Nocardioides sp. HM61]WQQ27229.1 helix-turn-helix transcriptional regulator [Nocardioides sp. HM61]
MVNPHRAPAAAPASLAAYRARSRTAAAGGPQPGPADVAGPTLDAAALHASYAAAAESDSRGGEFHRMVAAVLARSDRVPDTHCREWNRFLSLVERHRQNPKASLNCGVLANLVGIAAFGDDPDFVTLTELGCLLGVERLAAVQHRAARFIEPNPTFPITTIALRRMVAASPHPVAGPIHDSTIALLLEGVDLDLHLPVIRTEAELVGVVDGGSVLEWRHHLAMIAATPWSPYSRLLVDLARQAARPEVAEVVDRFTEMCREHDKEHEREQVAGEVRRIVSHSGVTQREFALWVGTSPSRLSTYISGNVTPSASLMLRMARTSRLLQERDVPTTPSSRSEQRWGAARAGVDGGTDRSAGPTERTVGALDPARPHLSVV